MTTTAHSTAAERGLSKHRRRARPGLRRRLAGSALAAMMAASMFAVPQFSAAASAAAPAEITDGLKVWYKLDESAGTVATDSSPNGLNGTVTGGATFAGGSLTFGGANGYVKLPNNIMAGMSAITVSADVWIDPTLTTGAYFFYNLGNTAGASTTANGQLFQTGDAVYRAAISTTQYTTERGIAKTPGAPLARGAWKHISYSINGNDHKLWEDGALINSATVADTPLPSAIGAGTTTANYLGRSAYPGDAYFKGKMKDFRVYNRVLNAEEEAQLAYPINSVDVPAAKAALTLGDTSAVIANLTLPTAGPSGTTVSWSSANPALVSNAGVVTRPAAGQPDGSTTLTATISKGTVSDTKAFTVTVKAAADNQTNANEVAAGLTVNNLADVRDNLVLPTSGAYNATVTWSSSNTAVVTDTGEVTRPANGQPTASVVLTATVKVGTATTTRAFTATVPPLPKKEPYTAYAFAYFTGNTVEGENIYFAASKGNNALDWQTLNDDQPVLRSTKGTTGLRDPFITRSRDGDKFYLLATDLSAARQGFPTNNGSRYLEIWESTDLVHWSDQRHILVSGPEAGMTWAPEAYWDETANAYVVYWASNIFTTPGHTDPQSPKIMYATTRDFYTFSTPQVWIKDSDIPNASAGLIDTTVLKEGDTYYRFTKATINGCADIIEQKSTELRAASDSGKWSLLTQCIGINAGTGGVEGPTIFKANDGDVNGSGYFLFVDEFGGRGYLPLKSTSLETPDWRLPAKWNLPTYPRHGTVMNVTQAEYNRMLQAYQPDALVVSAADVDLTVKTGAAPILPATVTATYADGSSKPLAVTWAAVDPTAYAAAGTFDVVGTFGGGVSATVTAHVTVTDADVAVTSVAVDPTTAAMPAGAHRQLKAVVTPANATQRAVVWTSSDSSVATVSATGIVTAVAAGTATITATSTDGVHRGTAAITVTPALKPVLRYTFDDANTVTNGAVVTDVSGNGYNGVVVNNGAAVSAGATAGTADKALVLPGGASNSTAAYVRIPAELSAKFAGKDDLTVSAWVKGTGGPDCQWAFALGVSQTQHVFSSPKCGGLLSAVNVGREFRASGAGALNPGTWTLVTVVLDGGVNLTMYADGVKVATSAALDANQFASRIFDASKGLAGYLGKSFYGPDSYFNGSVDDFQVFDTALTASEVQSLADSVNTPVAVSSTVALTNPASVATNKPVTVSATVSATAPFSGTVKLFDGQTLIETSPALTSTAVGSGFRAGYDFELESGQLPAGEHQMTAKFFSDNSFAVADSTSVVSEVEVYFFDYPPTAKFYTEVAWLASTGITTGNDDGSFAPNAAVSRQAMAAFLYRLKNDGAAAPACETSPFTDVATSNRFCGEIAWLKSQNITTGYAGDKFAPAALIDRQAMAAFLFRMENPDAGKPACTVKPFNDVALSNPFCGEIAWLKTQNITTGYDGGNYKPGNRIDRQAMAAFLYRLEN